MFLSYENYSSCDRHGDFVCSPDCIKKWVYQNSVDRRLILRYTDGEHLKISHNNTLSFESIFEEEVYEWLVPIFTYVLYEFYTFYWDTKQYTPDFYLPAFPAFLEVKGPWRASKRSKMKSFREHFPDVPLLVIPWWMRSFFGDSKRIRLMNAPLED
jgi:hypothetical protein